MTAGVTYYAWAYAAGAMRWIEVDWFQCSLAIRCVAVFTI